ncbi:MAG: Formimidoyltetrahydrofolate cyclodeaminase [Thermoleophilia bacterium]|nr:Formimidoyltetrahydrofolate cyclodeaminase [Thermoleophilia bacterium]
MHDAARPPLLESVPNVSAGRDKGVVNELIAAVDAGIVEGAALDDSSAVLADVHVDHDHDRTVFTVVGRGEALAAALEALAATSVELIDIHAGHGVHPRVGALDVLPVIALDARPQAGAGDAATRDAMRDAGRDAAHALVERLAAYLGGELGVPAVAYGQQRDGSLLANAGFTGAVRRGGPASVAERIASGELELLAGPRSPHPSAGVTIVGVRSVLVAFNVDLATDNLDVVRAIAASIRATAATNDALPGIRALGFLLDSRGIAQVSTNIERPSYVGPAKVLDTIVRLAAEHEVEVVQAELVGLAPGATIAPLRYACTRLGVPLAAAPQPSLDAAAALLLP